MDRRKKVDSTKRTSKQIRNFRKRTSLRGGSALACPPQAELCPRLLAPGGSWSKGESPLAPGPDDAGRPERLDLVLRVPRLEEHLLAVLAQLRRHRADAR